MILIGIDVENTISKTIIAMKTLYINRKQVNLLFGGNKELELKSYKHFLNQTIHLWSFTGLLLYQNKQVEAADLIKSFRSDFIKVGFADVDNDLKFLERSLRMHLFGVEASVIHFEKLDKKIADVFETVLKESKNLKAEMVCV